MFFVLKHNKVIISTTLVQGSGIGHSLYDVVASDLHPVCAQNHIIKYADVTYLLVPASLRSSICF